MVNFGSFSPLVVGLRNYRLSNRAKHWTGPQGPGTANQWDGCKTIKFVLRRENLSTCRTISFWGISLRCKGIQGISPTHHRNNEYAAKCHSWHNPTIPQQANTWERIALYKTTLMAVVVQNDNKNKQNRDRKISIAHQTSWVYLLSPALFSYLCQTLYLSLFCSF